MHERPWQRLRAVTLSVAIHAIAALLLGVSLRFHTDAPPEGAPPIVHTVAVDSREVEAEVKRLRDAEQAKQEEERRLERMAAEAERKRREEEERLERLKREQEEVARRKAEEEQERQRLEEERRIALAEKRRAEEEQRRIEEEKKKALEEKQKAEEARRLALEEKRRLEEERKKALAKKKREEELALERQRREELEAEERARQAEAQARQDASVIEQYRAKIRDKIQSVFINPNPEQRLRCTLYVRMSPAGDVIDARVEVSSGVPAFDRQAEIAVRKASPLPVPPDPRIFDEMREIRFEFSPLG